jgi:hypothetical protein
VVIRASAGEIQLEKVSTSDQGLDELPALLLGVVEVERRPGAAVDPLERKKGCMQCMPERICTLAISSMIIATSCEVMPRM